MSRSGDKVIVVTMGDPRGVGPELVVKALKRPDILRSGRFIVIGNSVLGKGLDGKRITLLDVPYHEPGEGALKFLDKAIALIKQGSADALVTAPLSKERVSRFSKDFVGHTEYLARSFGVKRFDMMFVARDLCLTIATRHIPLSKVSKAMTKELVLDSIMLMDKTLKAQFGIKAPKIAVLGLNPHAGEGGLLGDEEERKIIPAIKQAMRRKVKVMGPFPADTFFVKKPGTSLGFDFCDGIIAMYHDQGLAPMKGLYFKQLVNFTAGLPFVRTSPVHGTAFDIAGKGIADPSSMIAAVKLACRLA